MENIKFTLAEKQNLNNVFNIFTEAINEMKKIGIETIRLDAFALNPYALSMYNKLGILKLELLIGEKENFILWKKRYKFCEFQFSNELILIYTYF